MLAVALGTELRHRLPIIAVMAFHSVRGLVKRHGDRTVLALQCLAATAAKHHGRISAPIEKHHRLLAARQTVCNFQDQLPREDLVFSRLLEFSTHIHQLNFR